MTVFDRLGVTLCGWQDFKIQLLSNEMYQQEAHTQKITEQGTPIKHHFGT